MSIDDCRIAFKHVDKNKDGYISFVEFGMFLTDTLGLQVGAQALERALPHDHTHARLPASHTCLPTSHPRELVSRRAELLVERGVLLARARQLLLQLAPLGTEGGREVAQLLLVRFQLQQLCESFYSAAIGSAMAQREG